MNLDSIIANLQVGQTVRLDCPECGGTKTLGVSHLVGRVTWQCFKAMCGWTGARVTEMTREELAQILRGRTTTAKFELPKHIIKGIPNDIVSTFLATNHGLSAVSSGCIHSGFDPVLNRIVFFNSDVAVGRATNKRTKPKWYKYPGSLPVPMIVGNGPTAVLVEDVPSACSVAANPEYTGVALLGTNIYDSYIPYLYRYKKVIVALDKDAARKSLVLKEDLTSYLDCVSIWLLDDDLKYVDCTTELDKVVRNYECR